MLPWKKNKTVLDQIQETNPNMSLVVLPKQPIKKVILYAFNQDRTKLFLYERDGVHNIPVRTFTDSHMGTARYLAKGLFGEDAEVSLCGRIEGDDFVWVLYRTFVSTDRLPKSIPWMEMVIDDQPTRPSHVLGSLSRVLRECVDMKIYARLHEVQ